MRTCGCEQRTERVSDVLLTRLLFTELHPEPVTLQPPVLFTALHPVHGSLQMRWSRMAIRVAANAGGDARRFSDSAGTQCRSENSRLIQALSPGSQSQSPTEIQTMAVYSSE